MISVTSLQQVTLGDHACTSHLELSPLPQSACHSSVLEAGPRPSCWATSWVSDKYIYIYVCVYIYTKKCIYIIYVYIVDLHTGSKAARSPLPLPSHSDEIGSCQSRALGSRGTLPGWGIASANLETPPDSTPKSWPLFG